MIVLEAKEVHAPAWLASASSTEKAQDQINKTSAGKKAFADGCWQSVAIALREMSLNRLTVLAARRKAGSSRQSVTVTECNFVVRSAFTTAAHAGPESISGRIPG
jgi:hypothetical protein